MTDTLAPIVLFVYNRPDHTQQVINSLLTNTLAKDSNLYIYSDAPRDLSAQTKVEAVREYIHSINGFRNTTIVEREKNFGLAENIIDGVNKIVNQYGKIIVLEDDIVVSPIFLEYMNSALDYYRDNKKICSITGFCFLPSHQRKNHGVHASTLISSWGWGTWKDRWMSFNRSDRLLQSIIKNKNLHSLFNYDNSYDYIKMIKLQLKRSINSWAIYWYAYNFSQNKLTVYPNSSLVLNIGFDGSGCHCKKTDIQDSLLPTTKYNFSFDQDIQESSEIREKISNHLRRENKIKRWIKERPKVMTGILKLLNWLQILRIQKKIGKSTLVAKSARITGWRNISIGHHTIIGEHAWLNVNQRQNEAISIGNYCYLGPNTFLSSGYQIVIKDYAMFTLGSKILGANHIIQNPFEPYISTGVTAEKKTNIGYNVWVGTDALIVGGVDIGYGSIIGAGSIVTQNIPPFSIAVGVPAKIIKRFDFSQNQWVKINEYDEEKNLLLMPTEEEYLQILQNKKITMPYMALGKEMGDMI